MTFPCSLIRSNTVAFAVGSYITVAYWFTAATSYTNPAVSVARPRNDTLREFGRSVYLFWLPLIAANGSTAWVCLGPALQDFFDFAGETSATAASAVSSRKVNVS